MWCMEVLLNGIFLTIYFSLFLHEKKKLILRKRLLKILYLKSDANKCVINTYLG